MQALAIREVVFIEEQSVPEDMERDEDDAQAYRRSGVGTRLLAALEEEARKRGMAGIMLHAQLSAMDFYKRHGYVPHGAVFEEAGMPHLEMKRRL